MSVIFGFLAGAAIGYIVVAYFEAGRLGRDRAELRERAIEARRLAGEEPHWREYGPDE